MMAEIPTCISMTVGAQPIAQYSSTSYKPRFINSSNALQIFSSISAWHGIFSLETWRLADSILF